MNKKSVIAVSLVVAAVVVILLVHTNTKKLGILFDSNNPNPLGVYVMETNGVYPTIPEQVATAQELGANYIRHAFSLDDPSKLVPDLPPLVNSGMGILMNINNMATATKKNPFPTDMTVYAASLKAGIGTNKFELVVIENEEANTNYYSGTAQQYITELTTAVSVVHSLGMKVTNGGLGEDGLMICLYRYYLSKLMYAQAAALAKAYFPPELTADLPALKNTPDLQAKAAFVQTCLDAYKNIDIDYVNFHWYEPVYAFMVASGSGNRKYKKTPAALPKTVDTSALTQIIAFLENYTGKPAITNEIGCINESTDILNEILSACTAAGLQYVVWYSGGGDAGKAIPLQDSSGNINAMGNAFEQIAKALPAPDYSKPATSSFLGVSLTNQATGTQTIIETTKNT